jgi:hypothetical protein
MLRPSAVVADSTSIRGLAMKTTGLQPNRASVTLRLAHSGVIAQLASKGWVAQPIRQSGETPMAKLRQDARCHAPATMRNRDAILAALRRHLPQEGLVLEIASGTGEHAVHFAAGMPALSFQPSDRDERARASINAWSAPRGCPTCARRWRWTPPLRPGRSTSQMRSSPPT